MKNQAQDALLDALTGALVGLVRACVKNGKTEKTDRLLLEALSASAADTQYNAEALHGLIDRVRGEKAAVAPDCAFCAMPCGGTADLDMQTIWNAREDVRALKAVLLLSLCAMAPKVLREMETGQPDEHVLRFFHKALFVLGEDWSEEALFAVVQEAGNIALTCRTY